MNNKFASAITGFKLNPIAMKQAFNIFLLLTLFTSCSNNSNNATSSSKAPIVLYFELDSMLIITDYDVREQLTSIANDLEKTADRILVTGYSENTGNEEKNKSIAHNYAWAVKQFMRSKGARDYNVGIEIKGYANPIITNDPANIKNRRVEIIYLNQ